MGFSEMLSLFYINTYLATQVIFLYYSLYHIYIVTLVIKTKAAANDYILSQLIYCLFSCLFSYIVRKGQNSFLKWTWNNE